MKLIFQIASYYFTLQVYFKVKELIAKKPLLIWQTKSDKNLQQTVVCFRGPLIHGKSARGTKGSCHMKTKILLPYTMSIFINVRYHVYRSKNCIDTRATYFWREVKIKNTYITRL